MLLSVLALLSLVSGPVHALEPSCGCVCDAVRAVAGLRATLFHTNVFDSGIVEAVPIVVRQKMALLTLQKGSQGDSAELLASVGEKLGAYSQVEIHPSLQVSLDGKSQEQLRRDALEFVIRSFRSPEQGDLRLRVAAAEQLAKNSSADLTTIDVLMPSVRGADDLGEHVQVGKSIQRIHERMGGKAPDVFVIPSHDVFANSSFEKSLLGAKVKSIRPISSGNVNSTLLVTLELKNKQIVRGVVKPFIGESTLLSGSPDKILFTREVQAYDFFNQYFRHPQISVPETLEISLRFQGKSYGVASFQRFAEGKKTVNEFYMKGQPAKGWDQYGRVWEEQRKDPRWTKIATWIRVYDWVLGNMDRFPNSQYGAGNPNNMLVGVVGPKKASMLEVALIDTGNGRRVLEPGQFWVADLPSVSEINAYPELRELILSFDEQKIQQVRERYKNALSPNGLDDLANRLRTLREHVKFGGGVSKRYIVRRDLA